MLSNIEWRDTQWSETTNWNYLFDCFIHAHGTHINHWQFSWSSAGDWCWQFIVHWNRLIIPHNHPTSTYLFWFLWAIHGLVSVPYNTFLSIQVSTYHASLVTSYCKWVQYHITLKISHDWWGHLFSSSITFESSFLLDGESQGKRAGRHYAVHLFLMASGLLKFRK